MARAPFAATAIFLLLLSGLAAMSPARFALAEAGQDQGDPQGGEVLRIPGLPPIRMPNGAHVYGPNGESPNAYGATGEPPYDPHVHGPGQGGAGTIERFGHRQNGYSDLPSTVIGPGGIVRPMPPRVVQAPNPPPKVVTPAERAAQIRKALAPKPPLAFVRRHTLDELYAKLSVAKDEDEAKGLAGLIGGIWLRTDSDTAALLMQRAMQAIEKKDYQVALDQLDSLIALKPGWAEAWNKRASVRFYMGNFDGAMSDVERVLKIEPKHFGALDGMGTILQHTGFDKQALEVYRKSLSIYPHQPEVEKLVDKLTLAVEGQGI